MVARRECAALGPARHERGTDPDRRRRAKEDALLAAENQRLVLCEGRDVDIAKPRLNEVEHAGKHFVLQIGGFVDQGDLRRALDRLQAVDLLGRIDEFDAISKLGLNARHQRVWKRTRANPTDLACAVERFNREVRVIPMRIVDRQE